jgi:hypothetical protein
MHNSPDQAPKASPPIHAIPVLSAQACEFWADQVLALRPHWTRRDPHLPFYTLGLAAYLDAVRDDPQLGGKRAYHISALRQQNNKLMAEHFSPLLERCCQALAQWTKQTVRCLGEQAALPGFHIHLPHPLFAQEVASRHVDLQFQQVFGLPRPDPDQVLTLTLPVSLPAGAGLRLWAGEASVFHPYQLGHLAVHNGLMPHQAVLHPLGEPVARIMLQCHALQQDGAWGLYW